MEPKGLLRVGIATFAVGLVWGIIVPFAQFHGKFPASWVVGVVVLPALWGGLWCYLARPRTWPLWLGGQWLSLALACWLFIGSVTDWAPQAVLGGAVFGALLLFLWMVPVGIITVLTGKH
ncbi:hypothetical protein [Tessaracoccus antarcticus]|uniref:hypothetical protein n=1 Tax=Tessaracoccus antarcticus TaxID=2479848 RepID=UPI00131437F4|nr:hypothetical protein [Tessaracoccus antarcticus]